jgi:hypothetical protein
MKRKPEAGSCDQEFARVSDSILYELAAGPFRLVHPGRLAQGWGGSGEII